MQLTDNEQQLYLEQALMTPNLKTTGN